MSNFTYVTGSSALPYSASIAVPIPDVPITANSVVEGFRSLADRTAFIKDNIEVDLSSSINNTKRWIVESAVMNYSQSAPGFISSTADIWGFTDTHNGYVVAAGGPSGIIVTSADGGKSWVSGTLPSYYINSFRGIASGSATNSIVAVGQSGKIVSTTVGGGSWTDRTAGSSFAGNFFGITWASTISSPSYVAVGQAQEIQTSADGATWTRQFTGGAYTLRSAADGEGTCVTVGETILSTTDGSTWVTGSGFSPPLDLVSVAYGNGIWVAVGNSGEIKFSASGTIWAAGTAPAGFSGNYAGVTFAQNTFFAATTAGRIHTSRNGQSWKILERLNDEPSPLSIYAGTKIRRMFQGTTDGKLITSHAWTELS